MKKSRIYEGFEGSLEEVKAQMVERGELPYEGPLKTLDLDLMTDIEVAVRMQGLSSNVEHIPVLWVY